MLAKAGMLITAGMPISYDLPEGQSIPIRRSRTGDFIGQFS
jgi:hypothetical protein